MPPTTSITIDDDLRRRKHAEALAALIDGEVRFGKHDRMLYATDASIYQVEPIGVIVPAHIEDVRRTLAYCREHALPILPRGGGTSLAGQCVNHAVVIDFSAGCRRLEWVSEETRACFVEPGITIDELNIALRPHGLFFAPDPATVRQANIGGCIGNNAAGTRTIVYGRTSENLEAVSVLLSTGEECELARGSAHRSPVAGRLADGVIDICTRHERLIRERFPRTPRRNAGYALDMMLARMDEARAAGRDPREMLNLAQLICGSEGTLAIITGATLRLHPIPKASGLAVLAFPTVEQAVDAVAPLLSLGPSAVELIDDMIFGLARANLEQRAAVDLLPAVAGKPPGAVLYIEFLSHSGPEEIREKFESLKRARATAAPGATIVFLTDPVHVARALGLRKAGEPLLHGVPGARKPLGFVEDNAVPVERLAEFVRRFKEILAAHGTRASFWAHASVGVLHVRPLLDLRDERDRAHMEQIAVEVADLARSLGGVMSGEHGDGRARGPLLERYFGPELMGAFHEVKRLFDPLNLLNPGNIVEPGPLASIHEQTRIRPEGADLHEPEIDTFFDYSRTGGFGHAVEACNGSGVCRKKAGAGGTMCPSYMALLDERHATRGRANALRLAITGQSSDPSDPQALKPSGPAWNDPDTLETLRLCLSCKACKSECPTNVDVAQYKAEYLGQSFRAGGRTPLSARAFAEVRMLNRVGSAIAPLANLVATRRRFRWLLNPLLGLAPKRSLPPFAPSLFRQTRARFGDARTERLGGARVLLAGQEQADAPVAGLFADCFTMYNEPHIGLAAIEVLRGLGYSVAVIDAGCCGRPHISTGLLPRAQPVVSQTATAIASARHELQPDALLFCEPSCLSAVKDEWLSLRGRDGINRAAGEVATAIADDSYLVEDFIERQWAQHPRQASFPAPSGAVALHGHCHQKALWGAETSAALLRRIAGDRLRVLDTGCCGMAGSFGFTADRFDLSMQIGELALFPAVRAMSPEDVLIAPGTSCRHQLLDGVGVHALHPVEFAARLMQKD